MLTKMMNTVFTIFNNVINVITMLIIYMKLIRIYKECSHIISKRDLVIWLHRYHLAGLTTINLLSRALYIPLIDIIKAQWDTKITLGTNNKLILKYHASLINEIAFSVHKMVLHRLSVYFTKSQRWVKEYYKNENQKGLDLITYKR